MPDTYAQTLTGKLVKTYSATDLASTEKDGFMSKDDKAALEELKQGGGSSEEITVASGEFITVEVEKESAGALTIHGKTEQKQLSGKNLLPYPYYGKTITTNGVTFTDNGDGTITANGTATGGNADFDLHINYYSIALPVGKEITLNGCPSGGGDGTFNISVQAKDYTQLLRDYGNGATLTTKTELFYGWIRIYAGFTANNLVFKPMLRLASITDDTYEPYVGCKASPNPDFPQSVNGVVPRVKRTGKNFFNKTKDVMSGYYPDGTGTLGYNSNATSVVVKVEPNTTYMVSKIKTSRFRIAGYTANPVYGSVGTVLANYTDYTQTIITTNADTTYLAIYVHHSSDDTGITVDSVLNSIMVELGDVATSYEPYTESTLSYDTELFEGDSINAVGKVTRKFRKIVLDGVTDGLKVDYIRYTSQDGKSRFGIDAVTDDKPNYDTSTITNMYCTHLSAVSSDDTYLCVEGIANSSGRFYMYMDLTSGYTIDQFNAWLKAQYDAGTPVTIVYELATPIEEEPTRNGELILTKGINHVFGDSEMDLEYSPEGHPVFDSIYKDASGLYLGDAEADETVPLNADTLGGQTPDYYAKASEVSKLNSNLSNLLCGKGVKGLQRGSDFNMDTHHSVSNGYGENEIAFDVFLGEAQGTKPFSDGFLLTMIWRPIGRTSPILHQVAFEDTNATTKHRAYYNGAWSSWV